MKDRTSIGLDGMATVSYFSNALDKSAYSIASIISYASESIS